MSETAAPDLSSIRNIGVIAHIDAGKTTLTERMLFYTRKIHRMGEVHDGTATMDYLPEEQERGITITSACTSCLWDGRVINIIDTPGHVDFTIEVERSLRVLDGAVGVFCAVGGVEPQSETVWRQSERFGVPKLAFINKMDRPGADFEAVLTAMRERLEANPLPVCIPLGAGEHFTAIIDLVTRERLDFDPSDQGQTVRRTPLSGVDAAFAAPRREKMLETLAENDDIFLEQYLSNTFGADEVRQALRRATLRRSLTPVLVGSALRNIGVQPLLDAVNAYLPSPADAPPAQTLPAADEGEQQGTIVPCDPALPLLALVFKVILEGGRKTAFVRLYAGELREGDLCRNVSRKADERVSRLFRMHADRREQIPLARAGDIAAVIGLRSASTGDTLTAPGGGLILESIDTYRPVINLALEPRNADEGKTLDEALARFCAEDPTLTVESDEGSGHRILSGMGELHLDVILERIRREYGIAPRAGRPQVVRRETPAGQAEADGLFDRELGKEHHYGEAHVRVKPRKRDAGNKVYFDFDASMLPAAFRDAALQGAENALQSGPATGYPLQDAEVAITALPRREGLSTAAGCHMAVGTAVREALQAAGTLVLEPIMTVVISVPEAGLGSALSLFGSRGGKVEMLDERAGLKIVEGLAPLGSLFGFSTDLRSATQGRAGLVTRFKRFDALRNS